MNYKKVLQVLSMQVQHMEMLILGIASCYKDFVKISRDIQSR